MRRRLTRLLLAACIAGAALLPFMAGASDNACDDQTVIFSRNRVSLPGDRAVNVGGVNANAIGCIFFTDSELVGDNRYLAPGANQVTVRYTEDLGPDATIVAVLNGLGFADTELSLAYVPVDDAGLGGYFDSAWTNIPAPGSGSISADVYIVEGTERTLLDSVHFRTTDQ